MNSEGAYNKYGDSAMGIGIAAIGKHGAFWRIPYGGLPDVESLVGGRFFYAVGNKPLPAGYTETGAYVGGNRKLDARFCVKGFQYIVETNALAPTAVITSHYDIDGCNFVQKVGF